MKASQSTLLKPTFLAQISQFTLEIQHGTHAVHAYKPGTPLWHVFQRPVVCLHSLSHSVPYPLPLNSSLEHVHSVESGEYQ